MTFVVTGLLCVLSNGCQPQTTSELPERQTTEKPIELTRSAQVLRARSALEAEEKESARRIIDDLLIQHPNDSLVRLTAAEIYLKDNRNQEAIELLTSLIDQSEVAGEAATLLAKTLRAGGKLRESLQALRTAMAATPRNIELRRELWKDLNRNGLRQEASQHADRLCTLGVANRIELVSLLQRNLSYSVLVSEESTPEEFFNAGLGKARWLYTDHRFPEALSELSDHYSPDQVDQESKAFLGRLLIETQQYEKFPEWFATCNAETQNHNDFWGALGGYCLDENEYEAAARALLEALIRDPTDELSAHRLAKAFDALGRREDAKQARHRAILIVQLKNKVQELSRTGVNGSDDALITTVAETLLELGRPFESLNWNLQKSSSSQEGITPAIRQQIYQLSQNQNALIMAFEMSQLDLNRDEFEIPRRVIASLKQKSSGVGSDQKQPVDSSSEKTLAPKLVNRAKETGIQFQWRTGSNNDFSSIPLHEVMGGGTASLDFDQDGWPDLYVAQGSGDPPRTKGVFSNQCFRNLNGRFESITESAALENYDYSSGIAAGDINQDGFPDLWIGNLGSNQLLINNGDGTFQDATGTLDPTSDLFTSSVAVADLNGDRLPDLFEVAYVEMEGGFRLPETDSEGNEIAPSPLDFYASPDRWFENKGDGTWQAHLIDPVEIEPGSGLGVLVSDFDHDGFNEVFVANDGRANHLLKIDTEGTIKNIGDASGVAAGFDGGFGACMGIAAGDFDRNGLQDLHVSNFSDQPNHHFMQRSERLFSDLSIRHQHEKWSESYVGFGIKAIDLDRNGWLDLLATNGHIFDLTAKGEPLQMPAQVVMQRAGKFNWTQTKDQTLYWQEQHIGRSITKMDYNRDHRMDFVISHLDSPLALLENQTSTPHHWLQIELFGTVSERDAVGARIELQSGERRWTEWMTAGDGYLSSDQKLIDFGVGTAKSVDELVIFWPSGTRQRFRNLRTNQRLLITENTQSNPWSRDEE